MTHNPYQPPSASMPQAGPSWFRQRPFAVYPIAILCLLPLMMMILLVFKDWSLVSIVGSGHRFAVLGVCYSFSLGFAGILQLFLHRTSVVFFSLCCLWCGYRALQPLRHPEHFYLLLAINVCFLCYAIFLLSKGAFRKRPPN